jgi:hypothetical protein
MGVVALTHCINHHLANPYVARDTRLLIFYGVMMASLRNDAL